MNALEQAHQFAVNPTPMLGRWLRNLLQRDPNTLPAALAEAKQRFLEAHPEHRRASWAKTLEREQYRADTPLAQAALTAALYGMSLIYAHHKQLIAMEDVFGLPQTKATFNTALALARQIQAIQRQKEKRDEKVA